MNIYKLVSKVMRSIAMQQSLEKDENEIWVSEISTCLRRAYFNRIEPSELPPELALLAAMGRGVHDIVERAFELECGLLSFFEEDRTDCLCFRERTYSYKIEKNNNVIHIVGKPDLVCIVNNRRVLLEIKLSNDNACREDWLRQVRYYAFLTEADEAYLLVIKRDNGLYELKKVTIGGRIREEIEARALAFYKALKEKKPPRKERGPWCRYCPYKWKC